jgi:hypothetical protein
MLAERCTQRPFMTSRATRQARWRHFGRSGGPRQPKQPNRKIYPARCKKCAGEGLRPPSEAAWREFKMFHFELLTKRDWALVLVFTVALALVLGGAFYWAFIQ